MRPAIFATVALLLSANPYESSAQDMPLWKDLTDWEVRVDTTVGYGCFLITAYPDGSVLRIGLDPQNESAYIVVGNEDWRSIEAGKEYNLELQFDHEVPWTAPATGFVFDNDSYPFLWIKFSDAEFFSEFMRKQDLRISYRGKVIATLGLQGSYAATMELFNCQDSVEGATKPAAVGDPFAAPALNDDPFAR